MPLHSSEQPAVSGGTMDSTALFLAIGALSKKRFSGVGFSS